MAPPSFPINHRREGILSCEKCFTSRVRGHLSRWHWLACCCCRRRLLSLVREAATRRWWCKRRKRKLSGRPVHNPTTSPRSARSMHHVANTIVVPVLQREDRITAVVRAHLPASLRLAVPLPIVAQPTAGCVTLLAPASAAWKAGSRTFCRHCMSSRACSHENHTS